MSIFFDFYVGPTGYRFRRAVDDDKNDIELFVDQVQSYQLFGEVDIGRLIELSVLSICMIDEEKDVVGFMALDDHPNVPGVDPADWENWIRNMFQKYYLSRDTLFIHFMCCKETMLEHFFEEACISIFRNDAYLLNIVLCVNSKCNPEHVSKYQASKKRTMYTKVASKRIEDCETNPQYLHVALRQDYCPKLKIRRAVEEDNDDVIEILNEKCPRLTELYGKYYVSELVGRHPESKRQIIVPEYNDRAAGVMCLSSDINYKMLQALYELRPYNDLIKATPIEKEEQKRTNTLLSTFGDPIMSGKLSPFDNLPQKEKTRKKSTRRTRKKKQQQSDQNKQKVNFMRTILKTNKLEDNVVKYSDDYSGKVFFISPSPSDVSSHKSVGDLYLDDDPFDYEIVNIDKSLLSIAENFSIDALTFNEAEESPTHSIWSIHSRPQLCSKKRRQSHHIDKNTKESEGHVHNGNPDAIMIELFALSDDLHEGSSVDLLEAAFEVMKNYDYCIIRVPAADMPFPLLQHFTYVPLKQKCCSKYSLYVAHRASVTGKLRVRKAEPIDIPAIANFLQRMEVSDTVTTIEHSVMGRDIHQTFVFLSCLSIIGIGILEPPEQLNFIRAKYNLDPYHNHKYHLAGQGIKTGFSAIKVILVYPIFEVHFKFFAREMMRLSGSNSLIWMSAYRNKAVVNKTNTIASAMIPLLPRQFELDYGKVPQLNKIATMGKNMLPFNTWFLDKKLTSIPTVNVSTRILVVGASNCALAFLYTLLFSSAAPYLIFNDVTLISPNGLPFMRHTYSTVEMMFLKTHNTSEKYLKSAPLTYYVNTIHGVMININKQDKYVTLSNGNKHYYDRLFLFVGRQYQTPDYMKPLLESTRCSLKTGYIRMDVPNNLLEPDYVTYSTPKNVFIINNVGEASRSLKYVKSLRNDGFDYKVIVYGSTIHAYCCLTALLELRILPENIIFVDPFPAENSTKPRVSVFFNAKVDETIGHTLKSLGIEIYRSYYFQNWFTYENIATHAEFLSTYRMIKLECSAFFYFGPRGINTQAFLAVNKAGLAYDGGILIDKNFRTNDPSIYAAGTATAYYRRYFAEDKKHKYYDSYEVGETLGKQIRNELDPLFSNVPPKRTNRYSSVLFQLPHEVKNEDVKKNNERRVTIREYEKSKVSKKLPELVKPKVTYCKLPGGLQYLEVRSPGKKIPHHYVQSLYFRGIVMETFRSGYFKLHLSSDLVVDGITCLTYETFNLECFKKLYGRSAVVLNHVHLKYMAKKLDNFYLYFRSPWAFFLYHDQADVLFAMVKELLPKNSVATGCKTIAQALSSVGREYDQSTKKLQTYNTFEANPYIEAVTDYVIDWLSHDDILLPMYMQPSEIFQFADELERDAKFSKKTVSLTKMIRQVI